MEILSQSTDWFSHIFLLILVILAALWLLYTFVGGIITMAKEGISLSNAVLTLFFGILSLLLALTATGGIIIGPTVEYKAIVTDWNAVYDGGYEVVGIDGKIVTLRKD